MDIDKKSVGELIDSLITTDIKCFMAQENLMNTNFTEAERLEFAIETQRLNARRNKLMRAIDTALGYEGITVTSKTYEGR
jgi:hypothetical protein